MSDKKGDRPAESTKCGFLGGVPVSWAHVWGEMRSAGANGSASVVSGSTHPSLSFTTITHHVSYHPALRLCIGDKVADHGVRLDACTGESLIRERQFCGLKSNWQKYELPPRGDGDTCFIRLRYHQLTHVPFCTSVSLITAFANAYLTPMAATCCRSIPKGSELAMLSGIMSPQLLFRRETCPLCFHGLLQRRFAGTQLAAQELAVDG